MKGRADSMHILRETSRNIEESILQSIDNQESVRIMYERSLGVRVIVPRGQRPGRILLPQAGYQGWDCPTYR